MFSLRMMQHPVGQGGLFSGKIHGHENGFTWVYDCGSNQIEALHREIVFVSRERELDVLFISHLDSDHVNGVDRLLSNVKVTEVVLPYLDSFLMLALVARELDAGSITGTFIDMISDVGAWFRGRGVERVTFVMPNDGIVLEGFDDPIEPSLGEGRMLEAQWRAPSAGGDYRDAFVSPAGWEGQSDQVVPARTLMILKDQAAIINWCFLPYVENVDDDDLTDFRAEVLKEFGLIGSRSQLEEIIRDRGKRKLLKKCYRHISSDHNLVTMSLYCGPIKSSLGQGFCGSIYHGPSSQNYSSNYVGHWCESTYLSVTGWLLTGDANLRETSKVRGFLDFYKEYCSQVAVIMAPHHGSWKSSEWMLYKSLPNLLLGYAASGPNGYGHPDSLIANIVESEAEFGFLKISDEETSRLVMLAEL